MRKCQNTSLYGGFTRSLHVFVLLIALDATVITVPLPRICSDFKDLEAVAWYSTADILTITVFQPLFGPIYEQWDSAVVYQLTFLVFGGELAPSSVESHYQGTKTVTRCVIIVGPVLCTAAVTYMRIGPE